MVCQKCENLAQGLRKVMIDKEMVFTITSALMLLRSVTNPEDRAVASSVITKNLLALPREKRGPIMEYVGRAAGIRITLDSCQHSSGGGGLVLLT